VPARSWRQPLPPGLPCRPGADPLSHPDHPSPNSTPRDKPGYRAWGVGCGGQAGDLVRETRAEAPDFGAIGMIAYVTRVTSSE
jgi:hypothetical protein